MTALAGVVGAVGDRPLSDICSASLSAQRLYGQRGKHLRETDQACFGIDLFETLPEDSLDRQPLLNGRFLLVADLRLDNRREILAAVGHGETQNTLSDAGILLLAWERWQENCVPRLEGDFAFGVHDRTTGRLTLVRDSLGNRPLCFTEQAGQVLFASMPSGILAHVQMRHDLAAMARSLYELPPKPGATCFVDVHSVRPGEVLQFQSGQRRSTQCRWRVPPQSTASDASLIEEFRALLDAAVDARLRSKTRLIATHLSSGYDSSAVTATAARLAGADAVLALTSAPSSGIALCSPRGRIADESELAAATASFLGIAHSVVRHGQSIFSSFDQHWRYFQEPIVNPINEGWWLDTHKQAADVGAGVLLTGETGNATISFGGLQTLPHWVRRLQFLTWFREMRSAVARNDVRWRGALMTSFRPFMPQLLSDALEHWFQAVPPRLELLFVRPEWTTCDTESEWGLTADPCEDRVAHLNRLDAGLQRKGLLGRCRIDDRDPTGDRRLAEFALSFRPEHLLSQGVSKPLARRALADRLPANILDLPARGYQGADWFGRFDVGRAIEILENIECSTTASALLDTGRLRKALLAWPKFDPVRCVGLYWMGRSVSHALSVGAFITETERNPELIGC